MIEAEEMKDAVHGQMAEMVGQGLILHGGFLNQGFQGEHDIAEQNRRAGRKAGSPLPGWKGQHIGRRVMPTVVAV